MKRSKFLSILLAALIVMSSFSCLSLTSFAAVGDEIASGFTPDTENADPANQVIAWRLLENAEGNGVLHLYDDPGKPGWAKYADIIAEVIIEDDAPVVSIPGKSFYDCKILEKVDLSGAASTLTTIGAYAFNGCSKLTSIKLPNGVTTLGDYAFYDCDALTEVTLSASLDTVGKNVFKDCDNLIDVTVPNGVKVIGYGMFENCFTLGKTVVDDSDPDNVIITEHPFNIPDSVESIEAHAFEGCTALSEAVIPDSVISVGSYAFYESGITSAYIGHSIADMGEYVFGRCKNLASVEFKSSVGTISDWMFYNCGNLTTIVDFPESVTAIGNHAFEGTGLTEITIPNTVTKIGDSAFYNAENLKTVNLNDSLDSIGVSAFAGTAITSIAIPYSVSSISDGAFAYCAALAEINVDKNNKNYASSQGVLYTAGYETLLLCPLAVTGDAQGNVKVVDGTKAIGTMAFAGCKGIKSVSIPSSVTSIGAGAFADCSEDLVINALCNSYAAEYVKAYGLKADGITHAGPIETNKTDATCIVDGSEVTYCEACSAEISNNVIKAPGTHTEDAGIVTTPATCETEGVKTYTCLICNEVIRTAAEPALGHDYETVGKIIKEPTCDAEGIERFECTRCDAYYEKAIPATGHSSELRERIITPATCETTGLKRYECTDTGCTYYIEEVIPALTHDINPDNGVVTLKPTCVTEGEITYKCERPGCTYTKVDPIAVDTINGHDYDDGEITKYPTLNKNGEFTYTCKNTGCNEDVPGHTKVLDITTTYFDGIKDINEGAYVNEKGEFVNRTWMITDDNILHIYADGTAKEWAKYSNEIVKAVIEGDTTTITNASFAEMPALKSVSIETSLDTIEEYAFDECPVLEDVFIGSVVTVNDYAFYKCPELKTLEVYGGFKNMGRNIFKDCTKLQKVILHNGTVNIGYGMFENCKALQTIVLPDSIASIGDFAFDNCTSLKAIRIPDSVTTVGRYAFHNCKEATKLIIGHNAEDIGEYAFAGCEKLTNVEIDCAMRVLRDGMFMDCTQLSNLKLEEGLETIGKEAFKNCSALTSITLPLTLKSIDTNAFSGTGIVTIDIPSNVTDIASGAFAGCKSLENINVDTYNSNYYSVDGVLYDMALATLITCPAGKKGAVQVKDGTETISGDAFIGCVGVTEVTIPNSVTAIANNAFNGCADTIIIKGKCDSYAIEYAKTRGIKFEITEHAENAVTVVTKEPTCDTEGEKVVTCPACNASMATPEVIPALGHECKGVVVKKATCETDGLVEYQCQRDGCAYIEKTAVLPALTHKYDSGEVIKAPTCFAVGTMRYRCTNEDCYDYYDEDIEMTAHVWDEGEVKVKPECEKDGEKEYKCTNKGCTATKTEPIFALEHVWDEGEVTVAPGCTTVGELTQKCTNNGCTSVKKTEIPATGHTVVKDDAVAPTCTDKGLTEGSHCSVCGEVIVAQTEIDATGHTFKVVSTKPATCTEEGEVKKVCSVCGESETEKLPLAEHQYHTVPGTIEPTCTKDGITGFKCAICGQFKDGGTVIPATGHTYDSTTGMCHCGAEDPNHNPSTTPGGSTVVTPENPGSADKKLATPKLVSAKNDGPSENNGIKVIWEKVDGAAKYYVYRKGSSGSYKRIAETKSTSYFDKTAKAGYVYKYTVKAVDKDGNVSGYEGGLSVRRVITPNLVSVENTTKGVKITWEKVKPANSYRVYRKVKGSEWKYIGTSESTSFIDTTAVSGKTYYYSVKAVYKGTSDYETGLKIKFVEAPDVKSATNVSTGVKVSWGKVSGADKYYVYRKGTTGGWKRIATTKSTSYVDKAVNNKNGKTYKYTVRAVDGSAISAYESGKSVKVK